MFQKEKFLLRLEELRTEKGITQKDLAQAVGMTRQSAQQWEAGTRYPNIPTLCAIAEYFGVTVDYLLGQSDDR